MQNFKMALWVATAIITLLGVSFAQQVPTVINGVRLTPQEYTSLSQKIGQPAPAGRFWYDGVSGMWGYEGGPVMGQLPPSLPEVRGSLRADASGGLTQVFINGRALHPNTLAQFQMMYGTPVPPGRYAMNAYGQIVMEGQPFPQLPQQAQPGTMPWMPPQGGAQAGWPGGDSVYMPGRTSDGRADGLHVGKASDGCTYIVTGDYSAESCD